MYPRRLSHLPLYQASISIFSKTCQMTNITFFPASTSKTTDQTICLVPTHYCLNDLETLELITQLIPPACLVSRGVIMPLPTIHHFLKFTPNTASLAFPDSSPSVSSPCWTAESHCKNINYLSYLRHRATRVLLHPQDHKKWCLELYFYLFLELLKHGAKTVTSLQEKRA